jgi:hypothetical protein
MFTSTLRTLTCAALTLLCACGGGDLQAFYDDPDEVLVSSTEAELRSNQSAEKLVVYSVNIENMLFDWKDLVHEMAEHELRPDVVMVQQMTNRNEMDRMVGFMQRRLGVGYTGIVAQANPDDHRFHGEITPRPKVTTGIIFRTSRFDLTGRESWMPWGHGFPGGRYTCDERSNNSGYESLKAKLFDRIAQKHLTLVSLRHWTWHSCSSKNALEIVNGQGGSGPNEHSPLNGALQVVAGDFNEDIFEADGSYKCWYRQLNRGLPEGMCERDVNLGFSDPAFQECHGDKGCMRNSNGIDWIFARRGDGLAARTDHYLEVSYDRAHHASVSSTGGDGQSNFRAADGYNDQGHDYSQHRARRAWIYYP